MSTRAALLAAPAILVCGLVVGALLFRSRPPEAPDLRPELDRSRAEALALKAEVARLRREADARPSPVPAPSGETAALRRRVAELEAENAELKKRPEPAVVGTLLAPVPREEVEAQVARSTAIALDPARPAAERVKALEELRAHGRITPEVAAAVLRLFDTSPPPAVRADILRHLHRSLPLDQAGLVVRALQTDSDGKVREEAAETLGPLKEDPVVRAALERAAQNDPDLEVRAQALRSLAGRRR
jgi:hypothetical protein